MTKILLIGKSDVHSKRFQKLLESKYDVYFIEDSNLENQDLTNNLFSDVFLIVLLGISDLIIRIQDITSKSLIAVSMGYDLNYLEISEDMTSALNKCDGFIVDCFLHYQLLEQKIFANHKLFQSAYGCDVSLFSQIIPERGSGLNIMINRGPSKQHGNELVIKALQELNFLGIDYHATFVGDHFTNQYFELLLNKLRQNNRVTVLNSVDQTHMLEIMKQNWVYLSGSISDGSSISLLEAMSGGLIPVISDWSSNLEWISDNYNGIIFQNENFESLVQSLIKLSNLNESVRELMVARNRKIVHSRGNWEINGPQILAHIEKCLRS